MKCIPLTQSIHAALWDGHRAHTSSLIHRSEIISKDRLLARVFELWELLQRFLLENRKTVTFGSKFQWHRMGHKTCLLVWHTQPTQWVQSVTSGEKDNYVQIGRLSGCIQSQTGIMEVIHEHWDFDMFQILAEILKETEPGLSFLQLAHDHLF